MSNYYYIADEDETRIDDLDELLDYLVENVDEYVIESYLDDNYDSYSDDTLVCISPSEVHRAVNGDLDDVRESSQFREYIQESEDVEFDEPCKDGMSVNYHGLCFTAHIEAEEALFDVYSPKTDGYIAKGLSEEDAREKAYEYACKGWIVDVRLGDAVAYTPDVQKTPRMMKVRACVQVESYFLALCPAKFERLEFTIGENGPKTDLYSLVEAIAQSPLGGRYLQDTLDDRTALFCKVKDNLERALEGSAVGVSNGYGEIVWAKLVA